MSRVWKTLDGREIPIERLTTPHLKNIIAMLKRKGHVSAEEFGSSIAAAASMQGETAQMYAENEVATMKVNPMLDVLEMELEKRSDK